MHVHLLFYYPSLNIPIMRGYGKYNVRGTVFVTLLLISFCVGSLLDTRCKCQSDHYKATQKVLFSVRFSLPPITRVTTAPSPSPPFRGV
jgi:hypothetical protein